MQMKTVEILRQLKAMDHKQEPSDALDEEGLYAQSMGITPEQSGMAKMKIQQILYEI